VLVTLLLARSCQLLSLGKTGGWAIELQMFFLVIALVMAVSYQASGSMLVARAD
jgi:hypothetical protein